MVRQRRAVEIDEGLSRHLAIGGGAEFVTLTVRHHRPDALAGRLDVVAQALKLVLRGSAWERRRDRLGYVGSIRTTEITWGARNGWHPHCHAVLLFERPLTADERADLQTWLYGRWGGVCESRGFGSITRANGVDVRSVHGAGDLSEYLTKVEGGWSAGAELSRSDLKGHAPISLLREFVDTGEKRWLTLWGEYEQATFGKRAIVWSRGLRARLLGQEDEVSDVDLAASEGADLTVLRSIVDREVWHGHLSSGTTGELLSSIEDAGLVLLLVADLLGFDVPPLDLPVSHPPGTLCGESGAGP